MDYEAYAPYWNQAEPKMRAKLELLKQALVGKTPYTLRDIYQAGDEEFRLVLDMVKDHNSDSPITVLSAEFNLFDADVCRAEEDGQDAVGISDDDAWRFEKGGVGISLSIEGYNGLVLGGYTPYNYTSDAYTTDIDEILLRIEHLNIEEMTSHIVDECLQNPLLIRSLASAN